MLSSLPEGYLVFLLCAHKWRNTGAIEINHLAVDDHPRLRMHWFG